MGGLEAIGSSDTQEFANICSNFFKSDGILDITFSDILAGVYVTRLIHYAYEVQISDRLIKYGLASSQVKDGVRNEMGKLDALHAKVQEELTKDGLMPSQLEGQFLHAVALGEEKILNRVTGKSSVPPEESEESENGKYKDNGAGAPNGDTNPEGTSVSKSGVSLRDESLGVDTGVFEANQFLIPLLNAALSLDNSQEKCLIAEGARYISFANSIYYWSTQDRQPWYHRGIFNRLDTTHFNSDHRGRAMKASSIPNVEEQDIVYANYEAGIKATPFAVVLDHAWQSVVVTIRGSQSIDDFLSDLALTPVELDKCSQKYSFDGAGKFAHMGMLGSAEWITDDLLRVRVLEKLLSDEGAEYKNYKLRIVGHSLGAGAGSLVALFLKHKFPQVRAVVFEPPGCTMSWNLAEESNEWCTSFVTGMDVVTRFNEKSVFVLRNEIITNLARIRVPKHVVMNKRNIDGFGIDAVKEFLSDALYPHNEIPDSPFVKSVRTFIEKTRSKENVVGLHIPGKIIHLASESFSLDVDKDKSETSDKAEVARDEETGGSDSVKKEDTREYQTCWAKREDFQYIVLSSHFLTDHLTSTICSAFQGRMKAAGLSEPYSDVLE